MSSLTPFYVSQISNDVLRYVMAYATGQDGCIKTITASFQPAGTSVSGNLVNPGQSSNTGFFLEKENVRQGKKINVIFYSLKMPPNTFTITLSFTTSQGNSYSLATINTTPPDNDYALVVIVGLTFTVQQSEGVNISVLLDTFTAFASYDCQQQSKPQINYTKGFVVIYNYVYTYDVTFNAMLLALNINPFPAILGVQVTMGSGVVASAMIDVPAGQYAYFLFSLTVQYIQQ